MNKQLFTRIWMLLLVSVLVIPLMAQSVTVNVTKAGGLWDALEAEGITDFTKVKNLTVRGTLGNSDFLLIKNQMTDLITVDISGTDVTEIPENTFSNREFLTTVRLPEGITNFGNNAFNNCRQLEIVTFGSQNAVKGKITFPATLRYMNSSVFTYCEKFTHLDFSACTKLEAIESDALGGLKNLTELLLPCEGNLRLGWNCIFVNSYWDEATQQEVCKGLQQLTITKAVTWIEGYCMPRTMKTLFVESATPPSCSNEAFNNMLNDDTSGLKVYVPKDSKRNYAIADGWSRLYQFMQETGFKINITGYGWLQQGNATYTNGDVCMGASGSALTLKAVPDPGCQLISVNVNGNAMSVAADGTFTIPATTTTGTINVTFTANPIVIDNPNGGELKDKIKVLGLTPSTMHTLKVIGKINGADWNVITNMKALEMIDLSETNIREVPNDAFRNNSNLKTCRLPENITYIRNSAFFECKSLNTISFGTLGDNVFPSSLIRIEERAFSNCFMLEDINLSACILLQALDNYCFNNCSSLKSVILPPNGSFEIDWEAFRYTSLTTLTLTKAVNSLRCYCLPSTLTSLYVESSIPINVEGTCSFETLNLANCTLYVPIGATEAFSEANGWSNFTNVKETGFKIRICGFGIVQQGNITYTDGDVCMPPQGSAATLKAVPDPDCQLISVTLNGNAMSVAADGTFTIPATTTTGTISVVFTTSQTVVNNPNGGELKDQISAKGIIARNLRSLKVVGKMTTKDWNYVKSNLTALEDFDISETDVKSVPEQVFQGHQKLTTIHLPSTAVTIGNSAFSSCYVLKIIEGCENIKEIGSDAFNSCQKLNHFPFGDKIKSIESGAFYNCTSLPETLVMPASLNKLGWNGVFNNSSIRSFDLSKCTLNNSFAYNTFGKCTSLLLPEKGDYQLESHALEEAQLTELRLPAVVSRFWGDNVLPTTLEHLYVSRTTPFDVDNNSFNNIDFDNCTLYVPMGSADAYAEASQWANFTKVKELGIRFNISGFGTVQEGNITYSNGDVYMPSQGSTATLKAVPDFGCELISVTLDGNVINVATDGTFTIPATTTTGIIYVAFTTNQTVVNNPNGGELKDQIAAMGITARNIRALKVVGKMATKDWNYVKSNLTALEDFDISETDVESIPEQIFYENQKINVAHLPSTITVIENYAFYNCPQLTIVEGCESVKEIRDRAFSNCKKLINFPFGEKLQKLESAVFENCSSLPETLVMPASLNSFGWDNMFNGSSVRSFDLSQCTLTGSFAYNAFGRCTSLLLPEKGDYQLNERALEEAQLKELRLPAAVSGIGGENVLPTMLERLYVSRTTPLEVNNRTFNNIDADNCTLYVPVGSVEAYGDALYWSDFSKIKEYGMQVIVGEQGKVRAGSQTLMGTTTFFPTETIVTFDIQPNAGWHTDAVTLDGVNIPFANNKFILNDDQLKGKLKIDFAINQFNLQLKIAGSGKVKLGSLEYTANQTLPVDSLAKLNFTLEPAEGLVVNAITFNGKESVVQNGGKNYVTPAITANSTLAITFGPAGAAGDVAIYTVTTGEGGTVEYLNTSLLPQTTINVKKGVAAVFTLKPDDYYIIDKVKLNNQDVTDQVDTDGQLTVTNVNVDATLEVTFVMNSEIEIALEDGMRLNNALTEAQKQAVTKLTVTGQLWDEDFYTMRDQMPELTELDLSEATCEWIPYRAFCFTDSWDNPVGMSSLIIVRLPKNVRGIYSFAFAGCSNLKEVNFTELTNLESMDTRAFAYTALNVIDLRQTKLESIGDQFYKVKGLENVKLPSAITYLGSMFNESDLMEIDLSNCTKLKTLDNTFNGSRKLERVILPEGLTSLNSAFPNCEALTMVNLPKSLQSIGYNTFYGTKLQEIDLSSCTELTTIGSSAFADCKELSNVVLPASLLTIDNSAFYNSGIKSIDLSKTKLKDIKNSTFSYCRQLESVKLPTELKTIESYAFNDCQKLAGMIELPATIVSIGDGAFWGAQVPVIRCNATTPPVITNNSFGEKWETAFVPEGYGDVYKSTEIWEDKVILDKEVHAEVTVSFEGNLAVDINEQAHIAPAQVTHLTVHGPLGVKDFMIMRDNMTLLYDLDIEDADCSIIPEEAFLNKKVLMNVKLPRELLIIQRDAFRGCSSLKGTLTLPNSVTTIGWAAFQGCSSLEKVELSNALEVIRGYAFEGCTSLQQEITFPENFTSLGEYAFTNCRNLIGTVTFNKEFYMFMGNEGYWSSNSFAFQNCSNIEAVDLSECEYLYQLPMGVFRDCGSLHTVKLPPYLERIENEGFAYDTNLQNIEFPQSLMYIDNNAFQNCTSLQRVDISDCDNFATIGYSAFDNCASLESVSLPASLNWIQSYAFNDCRKLNELNVEALQPADLGDYVFRHVHTERCVLSIPTGTFTDYLSAPQWGEFVSMRKAIDVSLDEGASLTYSSGGDENTPAYAPRRAQSTDGQQGNVNVKDGSSLYVAENEKVIFYINPEENVSIKQVLFNGEDVTGQLQDNAFLTPGLTDNTSFQVLLNIDGPITVKELRMLEQDVHIRVAESHKIAATVYPTNATNKTILWSSSNEDVVRVANDGTVTGIAAGRAKITAKTEDGGFEKTCDLVVMSNDYYITLADEVNSFIDNVAELPLMLHNAEAAQGIQFDVYLPEGLDMDSNGYSIQMSGRAQNHTVTAARRSDGSIRVIVYSLDGASFNENDGRLLTLPIITRENVGDYKVEVKNINISGPNSFNFSAPDYTATIHVADYPLGDSNGNGFVSIQDATNTVDEILERWTDRFIRKAADVNCDGVITVSDVTATIDIILERPTASNQANRTAVASDDKIFIDDFKLVNGQQQTINLQLTNTGHYTAFQCDIVLPEGLTIAENEQQVPMISISSANAQDHIVQANYIGSGALRLLVMSMNNTAFATNANDVVTLTFEANAETLGQKVINIENVRLVDVESRTESEAPDTQATVEIVDTPSGIQQMVAINNFKIRVEGHELVVVAEADGVLRLTSMDGKQRMLQVKAGEQRFTINQAGVYAIENRKIMIK